MHLSPSTLALLYLIPQPFSRINFPLTIVQGQEDAKNPEKAVHFIFFPFRGTLRYPIHPLGNAKFIQILATQGTYRNASNVVYFLLQRGLAA